MNAFHPGQRVRLVRRKTSKDRARLKLPGNVVTVPLGTEGVVWRSYKKAGCTVYSVQFSSYAKSRGCLGYQIEPLTDSYQLSTWEALHKTLNETWNPQHDPEKTET